VKTEIIAKFTRAYRRLHKWVAVPLFLFMFIIGGTGVLLGWKKQANLRPPTQMGESPDSGNWLSLYRIEGMAKKYTVEHLGLDPAIDRIDVRPGKGIAKIIFKNHYTELQMDLTNGKVLSSGTRYHDVIEDIHDGTIVDRLIGSDGEPFKVTYTTLTSVGLMVLSFSGFWLWYNPKRIRKIKYTRNQNSGKA